MKEKLLIALFLVLFLIPYSLGIGYLLWGTRFLYHRHKFPVNPNMSKDTVEAYKEKYGYRGVKYISNLNQHAVENNKRLYDVEDATRNYNRYLSYWR